MSCVQMTDDSNTRAYDTYVAPQLQRSLWSHVFKVSSLVPFMGSGNNWGFLSFCPSLCFLWAHLNSFPQSVRYPEEAEF